MEGAVGEASAVVEIVIGLVLGAVGVWFWRTRREDLENDMRSTTMRIGISLRRARRSSALGVYGRSITLLIFGVLLVAAGVIRI